MRKYTKSKLVCGVGINDSDCAVSQEADGKRVMCPFYQAWRDMLRRCYNAKCQAKYPSYVGCTVCDDWIFFRNFKAWMEKQDWHGKELDKDLLANGNKVYSPENCVFVDCRTNTFTTDRSAMRGEWPLGVDFNKRAGKFQARCNNPFTRKSEYLGYFASPYQAHKAWKKRKHELACQLAELQTDQRVANALRIRYL